MAHACSYWFDIFHTCDIFHICDIFHTCDIFHMWTLAKLCEATGTSMFITQHIAHHVALLPAHWQGSMRFAPSTLLRVLWASLSFHEHFLLSVPDPGLSTIPCILMDLILQLPCLIQLAWPAPFKSSWRANRASLYWLSLRQTSSFNSSKSSFESLKAFSSVLVLLSNLL